MSTNADSEMHEKRRKAEQWVNGYTATAVGTVLATSWLPGAASVILCTLECTMCYQIGKIYHHDWTMGDATATAGVVGLAGVAGQMAAMEATALLGPFVFLAKPAIAASIVKALGQLVIKHFEDCTST
jgi:uncharacterized protein (DUF697 family)